MSQNIVGILLAAGQSKRFGGNKLLHRLQDGTPIVVTAARHLYAVLPESIVVVDDMESEVAILLETEGLRLVVNQRTKEGIGTSIACGVAASQEASGWVIALSDMPFISDQIIQKVVTRLEQGSDIIAPTFRQQRGHPVGFSRKYANELMQLHSDEGARSIIAANSSSLDLVEVNERGVIIDIDTTNDLRMGHFMV